MEVIGSALGVLASVEQVITTAEALRDRYVAFRQNPEHVSRLLTSYQSFTTHLHAMDDQFRGKLCNLPPPNKAIFERHIREMVESFDSARNTLDQLSDKLARGRLMRFLRSKVQADTCNELLSELHRVEGMLFDINSFLATADVIESVKEDIRAGGEIDEFRPSFPIITASPDLVLDFDSVDSDEYPNTVEATVKKLILDGGGDGNGVVSLQGMGGVGKSSVLRELALDLDVRKQFPDGIHLITLGVDATHNTATRELLNAVSDSGGVVTSKKLQSETALDAVIRGVAKWFQSRKCLFLIDDLWSANRLGASFLAQAVGLIGNERQSRVLVTTRDLEIASYGHIVAMKPPDALSDQSKAIMMRYAKVKYEDVTDEKTKSNIEELLRMSGGLPVTLAIVGKGVSMLSVSYGGRKNIAWRNYLRTLRACREDLMSRKVGEYSSLAATFSASISLLEERRHTMPVSTSKSFAQMHKALCVLKKQGSAPVSMLRLLWNLENDQNAAFIAREFARVGLAEISLENIDNDYHEFLQLHDVIHDFAVSQAKADVSTIHDELLNSYATTGELVPPADDSFIAWWLPALKPDSYVHTNLCRHLRLAERETELLDLLCRPEWLKRQFTLTNTNQVEDDLLEGIIALRSLESEELCVTERDLKDIAGALRLSSTFLSHNPSELCFQLFTRLTGKEASSAPLQEYLKRVEDMAETPWLRPLDQCLATSGGPLKSIIKVDNPLSCLCMSIDGKQALCGSDDGCVYVISLEGGVQPLSKWKAHDAVVSSVSISSDGCKLVTGSWDCTSKVWDFRTRSCIAVCSLHQDLVNGVELAPDDETVVSASQDDTVKVWKIATPEKELFSFKNHYGWVFAVATSPDGRFVFSGGDDQAVLAWSIHEAGRIYKRFAGHKKWVKCLKVSNDGALLASGSGSVIRIWDLVACSKDPLKVLEASTGSLRALAMSPDGSRVVSGYDDNSVRVWDLEVGEQVGGDLISHSDSVTGVSLSADGNTAISCSWDGSLRVWDLSDLHIWRPRRNAHEKAVTCLTLTSDGCQLVSGSKDRAIKVWDLSTGRQTSEEYLQAHGDDISGVAVTPDGQRLVSTSLDKTLRIWDRQTLKEVAQMTGHERNISCLAISADGMQAYTGSYDLTVRIWDLEKSDGSHVILSGHEHWIWKVFVSEDGKRIISVSWLEVRVWEIERGECVRFVHLEDAHLLSRADLFATVGEEWRRRSNIDVPLQGRQIVWDGDEAKTVLGTLEADVVDWCFSEPLSTACVGLSSGQIAFFKLKT